MSSLASLGERIVVLGPSNAGKSTLAVALSEKLGLPAVHLDQLHHLPHTDWQPRPEAEFAKLHDSAILEDRWVMEGNYSRLMPQRLARATGAILLSSHHWLRFSRYLKRTLVNRSDRAGHLEGAKDSIKWEMVHWILVKTRNSSAKYASILQSSGLPTIECHTAAALDELYRAWDLPVRKQAIRKAIRAERILEITYSDERGAISIRRVWPFALGYFEHVRVVAAWCELRQDFRNFRTDRIGEMVVQDSRYPKRRAALMKAWRAVDNYGKHA